MEIGAPSQVKSDGETVIERILCLRLDDKAQSISLQKAVTAPWVPSHSVVRHAHGARNIIKWFLSVSSVPQRLRCCTETQAKNVVHSLRYAPSRSNSLSLDQVRDCRDP